MRLRLRNIALKEAERFHGHLGPYLVLGLLAGGLALKELRCKKYFGLKVKVWGAVKRPKSCLIDGLQVSTGATYGKGNIEKLDSPRVKIEFYNYINRKKITLRFKEDTIKRLEEVKTHKESEDLAKEFYKTDYSQLFYII